MAVETTEQIVREAPEIEAYKLALLQEAQKLAKQPIDLPIQQIAGLTGLQTRAAELAEAGIGAYTPYLTEGGYTMGDAYTQLINAQQQASPFIREAYEGALPYQLQAQDAIQAALQGVPTQVSAAQRGMEGAIDYGLGATTAAEENILGAAEAARLAAGQGTGALRDIGGQIPGMVGGAQEGMLGAAAGAQDLAAQAGLGVRSYMPGLGQQLDAATAGGLSAQQQAAQQARHCRHSGTRFSFGRSIWTWRGRSRNCKLARNWR